MKKNIIWITAGALLILTVLGMTTMPSLVGGLVKGKDIFGTYVLKQDDEDGPSFSDLSGRIQVSEKTSDSILMQRFDDDEVIVLETEDDRDMLVRWIEKECPSAASSEKYEYLISQLQLRITEKTLKKNVFLVLLTHKFYANRCFVEAEETDNQGEIRLIISEVGEYDLSDWGPFSTILFIGISRSRMEKVSSVDIVHQLLDSESHAFEEDKWVGFPWFYSQEELFKGEKITDYPAIKSWLPYARRPE